jgi:hypothetical protein
MRDRMPAGRCPCAACRVSRRVRRRAPTRCCACEAWCDSGRGGEPATPGDLGGGLRRARPLRGALRAEDMGVQDPDEPRHDVGHEGEAHGPCRVAGGRGSGQRAGGRAGPVRRHGRLGELACPVDGAEPGRSLAAQGDRRRAPAGAGPGAWTARGGPVGGAAGMPYPPRCRGRRPRRLGHRLRRLGHRLRRLGCGPRRPPMSSRFPRESG